MSIVWILCVWVLRVAVLCEYCGGIVVQYMRVLCVHSICLGIQTP